MSQEPQFRMTEIEAPSLRMPDADAVRLLQTEHNCRAEPHCLCGENAWYHRDTDDEGMSGAAECGLTGCSCTTYRRCLEYKRVENCS
jgi:hypothetical protein